MYDVNSFIMGAKAMFYIVVASAILLTIRDKLKDRNKTKDNSIFYNTPKKNKKPKINLIRNGKRFNPFKNKYHQNLDNTYDYINQCWEEIEHRKK